MNKGLTAVIFDMDGLLIDSEPLWQRAETAAFACVGLHLNDQMCKQTMGMRCDEVVRYWYAQYPWSGVSLKDVESLILDQLISMFTNEAAPMAGAVELVRRLAEAKMKLAVASSSPRRIITAIVERLGLSRYFSVLCSAQDQPYGKPHPGVFLDAAMKLGCQPGECVVFEDSINGVIAAKAARMKTVAVPDPSMFDRAEYSIADLKIASLRCFEQRHLCFLDRR
jgi:sugar-phosphatase